MFKHHHLQYLLLAVMAIFFLLLLRMTAGDRLAQSLIIFLFAVFYMLWGVLHHIHDKSLHLKVVLEYILIGAIGLILLLTLIK